MTSNTRLLTYLALTSSLLSSCVYYTPTVPDMPYEGTAGRTKYPDTWVTTQPAGIQQAPIPEPATSQPITPATANAPLDLTQPVAPGAMTSTSTPAPEIPAPTPIQKVAPATPTQTTQPTDLSQITNNGPIPVATRVPGDPTRVYNPLNPSRTIRVVDKDGNPYPSGKKLKVRGTNFMFYVP